MGKKEEFAKIFSSESKLPSMQLLRELSFMAGWDSCLKYLGEIPWDEAMWKSHATLTLLAKQDCPLWLQYD